MSKMNRTIIPQLLLKSSTKAGAHNVVSMDINLMIPSAMNHSHSHKIGNLVLFDTILETWEVRIGEDLFTIGPTVGIKISFQDTGSSVERKDIGRVIDQK